MVIQQLSFKKERDKKKKSRARLTRRNQLQPTSLTPGPDVRDMSESGLVPKRKHKTHIHIIASTIKTTVER